MRGLTPIPSNQDLQHAYACFQDPQVEMTLEQIIRWSQWVRFDPRLGEQWIAYLGQSWRRWNPLQFHEKLMAEPWPAVMGVLLDHWIWMLKLDPKKEPSERVLFEAWAQVVLAGVTPAHGEQFFIGIDAFAGEGMRREALLACPLYLRWGYLGSEWMVNKMAPPEKLGISSQRRRYYLDEWIRRRTRLTVEEYRRELRGWVSRRQAQRDLATHPRLRASGHTRGRFYFVKS